MGISKKTYCQVCKKDDAGPREVCMTCATDLVLRPKPPEPKKPKCPMDGAAGKSIGDGRYICTKCNGCFELTPDITEFFASDRPDVNASRREENKLMERESRQHKPLAENRHQLGKR